MLILMARKLGKNMSDSNRTEWKTFNRRKRNIRVSERAIRRAVK